MKLITIDIKLAYRVTVRIHDAPENRSPFNPLTYLFKHISQYHFGDVLKGIVIHVDLYCKFHGYSPLIFDYGNAFDPIGFELLIPDLGFSLFAIDDLKKFSIRQTVQSTTVDLAVMDVELNLCIALILASKNFSAPITL
jgi:hypothetical protein